MPSTPTAVMLPPKQPKRSTNVTSTPARAAANAAARPAGPEPTTSTSVSWMTSIWRAGSVMVPNVRRLRGVGHGVLHYRPFVTRRRIEAAASPERDVDEPDQDRHLDQRADDTGERFSRSHAEDADRDRDRQFEVVAGGGERDRGVAVVREPEAQPGEERRRTT